MKGVELTGKGLDAIGGGTSGMTRTDAVLGSTLGEMTPLGLVNGFFGKKSKSLDLNEKSNNTMSTIGSSYGGAVNDWNNAFQKSRKKYGLFSSGARHKANNLINNANGNMNTMNGISDTAQTQQLLENTMGDVDAENYRMNLLGGYNKRIQIGKNGIRLTLDRIKDKALAMQNSSFIKDEDTEDICDVPDGYDPDMFKPGYSNVLDKDNPRMFQAGGEMNLIPEGALHARKNDMKVDNITKKGIPVVDENGKQQAEIEKNEIIFKKDVSHQLEILAKDGSDDAAIKAGKILAHEIMENTDDRTGLIPAARNGMKLQHGGTVQKTKYGQPAKDMKLTGSIADNRMANEKDILDNMRKALPGLAHVQFRLVPDPNYTKEKTQTGAIEYLPKDQNDVVYPNGYKWSKPDDLKGQGVILFNPNETDNTDIYLDALHAMREQDPKYR